ncbi:hypothetical protein GOP47_0009618 [Adiantum capillus-veneris]|uniref:Uncharacterized protein n=1 Tax=Adiantum capillus-veneris TaxID=13818 RepID=A0A9D4UXF0_ADICA|nr:hypothetical protein GOP47_0009618 [Adiantum capillus-veneris]
MSMEGARQCGGGPNNLLQLLLHRGCVSQSFLHEGHQFVAKRLIIFSVFAYVALIEETTDPISRGCGTLCSISVGVSSTCNYLTRNILPANGLLLDGQFV